MVPVGYMAKHVEKAGKAVDRPGVRDIYSVSWCISEDFADYIKYWKHNGYWFFDSPDVIRAVAKEARADLQDTKLFYYEA